MTTALTSQLDETAQDRVAPPFWVKRVRVEGYKSIASCDVTLEPFTAFVGRNGAGKGNFLSALALLGEVPTADVRELFGPRRGLEGVLCRCRPGGHLSVGVELEVTDLQDSKVYSASYEMVVSGRQQSWPDRLEERLRLAERGSGRELGFTAQSGEVTWAGDTGGLVYRPSRLPNPHRFLLGYLGEGPFRSVSDGLGGMGFYNFHPDGIRDYQPRGGSGRLDRHGRNLPGVLASREELEPERLDRVKAYLRAIVPEVEGFERVEYGDREAVRFHVRRSGEGPLALDASALSDGTLRALAALLAVFQRPSPGGDATVVGIEEPEAALHPAAVRSLLDAFLEATAHTQVLLTTHSTELLAEPLLTADQVRVVRLCDGRTQIGLVDAASREIVRRGWNTLAGLHQEGRLEPDPEDLARQAKRPGTSQESPG
jgi:predicted ATPase